LSGNLLDREAIIFIHEKLNIVMDEEKEIPAINLNHYNLGQNA
jgi:hypothetical protein